MKTKDFIEMLQKADPEGEGYIRMAGGIPTFAEVKEGYWDGPYSYIDEQGNYIYSTDGYKVDIHCVDIWDFVQHIVDENTTWEQVEIKFRFKLGYGNNESRIESILKTAKEAYDFCSNLEKQMLQESIDVAVQRYKDGWRFFQDKRVDSGDKNSKQYIYYSWRIYNTNQYINWFLEKILNQQCWNSSSVSDTEGILKSGLFERLDNNKLEGYYEWVLK